jgi:hypothetical protein
LGEEQLPNLRLNGAESIEILGASSKDLKKPNSTMTP